MKAAYLCENPETLRRVYGERQRAALEAQAEFLPDILTTLRDSRLRDVEVVFSTWGMPAHSVEEIREWAPNLRAVFYAAGSVQGFARPYLDAGVRIFSAWQANAIPVVQFTHAQILLALKGYFQTRQAMGQGRAAGQRVFAHYPGVFNAKVGLLGCGAIGSRVAELLKSADVEVLVYDPFLSEARAAELGVRRAELDELFAVCDVVSNHLANLPATVGIIRREHLLSMKPYSTFINTGRGPQLSEADLADMLVSDPTRFALLDVLTDEQHSDASPLSALPNCWITPHIAGSSGFEVQRMAEYMIDAHRKYLSNLPCPFEVLPSMLPTMS